MSSKLKFDPENRMILSDETRYRIDQVDHVLDQLCETGKPIVLFVHGRGKEPKKSIRGGGFLKGRAVQYIERDYDTRVVMFNWDAKRGSGFKDRTRPLSKIPKAAIELQKLLTDIADYKRRNPGFEIALMIHSMGTMLLKRIVDVAGDWIAPAGTPLFSNIVMSASDADNIDHHHWLEKISAVEKVYLTINADDRVLKRSYDDRQAGAHPLGRNSGDVLANDAIYVDITDLGRKPGKKQKSHVAFKKNEMKNHVYLCQFFQQALTGRSVVLDNSNSHVMVPGQRYQLKFLRDDEAPCFGVGR